MGLQIKKQPFLFNKSCFLPLHRTWYITYFLGCSLFAFYSTIGFKSSISRAPLRFAFLRFCFSNFACIFAAFNYSFINRLVSFFEFLTLRLKSLSLTKLKNSSSSATLIEFAACCGCSVCCFCWLIKTGSVTKTCS